MPKRRLDVLLVERGLAESRTQAQALVHGRARARAHRSRASRSTTTCRSRSTAPPPYVSRAGHKLANALDAFGVDVAGLDCLDVGASTGGFTDVLLQRGAARVIALDVGYGQLHDRMRHDPRVTVLERTNARTLDRAAVRAAARHLRRLVHLGEAPRCRRRCALAAPGWQALVLVKPQFEAGRAEAPKGVVRDPAVRRRVVREVADALAAVGAEPRGVVDSGLPGPKGNHEFVLHLVHASRRRSSPPTSTAGSTMPSVERAAVVTHGRDGVVDRALARLRARRRRSAASSCSSTTSEQARHRDRARRRRHDAARARRASSAPACR